MIWNFFQKRVNISFCFERNWTRKKISYLPRESLSVCPCRGREGERVRERGERDLEVVREKENTRMGDSLREGGREKERLGKNGWHKLSEKDRVNGGVRERKREGKRERKREGKREGAEVFAPPKCFWKDDCNQKLISFSVLSPFSARQLPPTNSKSQNIQPTAAFKWLENKPSSFLIKKTWNLLSEQETWASVPNSANPRRDWSLAGVEPSPTESEKSSACESSKQNFFSVEISNERNSEPFSEAPKKNHSKCRKYFSGGSNGPKLRFLFNLNQLACSWLPFSVFESVKFHQFSR